MSGSEKADNALIFGQYADDYARSRPRYPAALWQWAARLCNAQGHAWDAGCGNGQAAVALAGYFDHVTATDASAEQIAAALPHPRVRYATAASEDVQLDDASLDLVCIAQALHWFDLPRFWPRVQRALKPGGVVVAVAYGMFECNEAIDAATRERFYDVVAPFQAEGNRKIAAGYAGLPFPFETIDAPALAIECDWTLGQLLAYAATWSAVARMRQETGVDPIAAYRTALLSAWGGNSEHPQRIRMPLTIKAGRHTSAV
jgi:SAM-dependent methyltransferase